jgi:hypothetical protein
MNYKLENLMYQAGLTAQGCWDEMDEYDREAIMRLARLIILSCAEIGDDYDNESAANYGIVDVVTAGNAIREHFGVE